MVYLSDRRGDVSIGRHEVEAAGAVVGAVRVVDVALSVHEYRGPTTVEHHHRFTRRKHRPNVDRWQHSMSKSGRVGVEVCPESAVYCVTVRYLEEIGPSTAARDGENLYRVALAGLPPVSALNTTTT